MIQPGLRFLFAHPAHLLACGLGSGLSPIVPGTVGTLFAWITYPLIKPHYTDLAFGIFILVGFVLGIFACERTGRDLGVADHGAIVWDEIVPFWFVLFLTPAGWAWQIVAFGLFRFFDIVKPPPAHWIDTRMKSGLGVMLDDVVAAFFTLLSLALLKHLFG